MLSFPRTRESIASPSATVDTCFRRYDSLRFDSHSRAYCHSRAGGDPWEWIPAEVYPQGGGGRYDSPHLNVIPADAGIHVAALVIARKEGHD
jgi:hypothetical protein